jgi:cytochrome c553
MPAWPAPRRDDEVRAVVAFLLFGLPKLDAVSYRRLIDGDAPSNAVVLPMRDLPKLARVRDAVESSCARCHGMDGTGRGLGAFPKLAGQRQDYVVRALDAYAEGSRHSGIMGPIAAALKPEERLELADFYASLLPSTLGSNASGDVTAEDDARIRRGREIAMGGIPNQGVPSCVDCHGPGTHPRKTAYPNLAGQYANYLVLQLELLDRDERGGSAYSHIMRHVATRLSPEQMRDVTAYYQSLLPRGDETAR